MIYSVFDGYGGNSGLDCTSQMDECVMIGKQFDGSTYDCFGHFDLFCGLGLGCVFKSWVVVVVWLNGKLNLMIVFTKNAHYIYSTQMARNLQANGSGACLQEPLCHI